MCRRHERREGRPKVAWPQPGHEQRRQHAHQRRRQGQLRPHAQSAARRRLEESLSALEAKGSAGEIVRLPGAGISSAPLVLAVGVVGTAGGYAVGPWIIRTMYATDLHSRTLAMLALGSALYMLALALAQAVLALNGHALVGLGWSCGMAAFVIVTWLSSHDLFFRHLVPCLVS